jgi:GDP-L-fucose synthase
MRKFHEAKQRGEATVTVWGTGTPMREFMYVDDLADGLIFLMQHYNHTPDFINIGTGQEVSINDLALIMKNLVGFKGDLVFDPSKPDGTPRKLMDVSRLHQLGWQAKTDLNTGIAETYRWFQQHDNIRY